MIAVEERGPVLVATLNRPERRNALGHAMMAALANLLREVGRNPAIRVLVLAAAPPAFCAGSDLKELGGLSIAEMQQHEAETAFIARQMAFLGKPVIAAVEGYALGGGFILAASCDIVVSGAGARWHLPEVKNGWLPPWGLQALIARVGPVRARLLTWGAEAISGEQAQRLGVVDETTADGDALDRAIAIADALAALPANAVESTKRFFEPFVTARAEGLDELAGRVFAADCEYPEAKAVLARFGRPA